MTLKLSASLLVSDTSTAEPISDHRYGLACSIFGTLWMVPDATLVRLIASTSTPTIMMYRCGLTGMGVLAMLVVQYRSGLLQSVKNLGPWGAFVCVLVAVSNTLFIAAVKTTDVANAMLIIATSSLWAALIGRIVLGTRIPYKTLVAIPVVVGGIAIMLSPELNADQFRIGDLLALGVAVCGATRRTLIRVHRDIDMVPAAAVGALGAAAILALGGASLTVASADVIPLVILGVVIMPISFALVTIGARYISGTESSLVMCLETALSPIMASMVLGDPLTFEAKLGGAIVVVALVVHSLWPQADEALQGK